MTACERCWNEYQLRRALIGDANVTYSQVVAERDARGGCTPEEQCGELHVIEANGRCRCGAKTTDAGTKPAGTHGGG